MHRPILPYRGARSKYWILVADGDGAKILTRRPENQVRSDRSGPEERETWAFEPVPEFDYKVEPLAAYDAGRNAISTVFESVGKLRHLSAPHVNLRRKLKDDLACKVANALNHAKLLHRFDELVVIAPPAWLGSLRSHLNADVKDAIVLEISKDLTRLPPPRLSARLRELLPVRAAG